MKTYKELITELFDKPARAKQTKNDKKTGHYEWTFDIKDGDITHNYGIEFYVRREISHDTKYKITGLVKGEAHFYLLKKGKRFYGIGSVGMKVAIKVFATVVKTLMSFIKKNQIDMVKFIANKEKNESGSRARIYEELVRQNLIDGYSYRVKEGSKDVTVFIWKTSKDYADSAFW